LLAAVHAERHVSQASSEYGQAGSNLQSVLLDHLTLLKFLNLFTVTPAHGQKTFSVAHKRRLRAFPEARLSVRIFRRIVVMQSDSKN
jgi:hypothetical protein